MSIPNNLPSEYTPSILTKSAREKTMYCIGYRSTLGGSSYGFFMKPTQQIEKLLETVPVKNPHKEAVILFFDTDGTEKELYIWGQSNQKWIRCS